MLTRSSRLVAIPCVRVAGRRWKSTTPSSVPITPLQSILIANRGEIALRVGRTAAASGIKTTVLYTDPDAQAQHALSSPYAINLGDASRYLDGDYIIEVAKKHGCQGIHPGYGFLSENAGFAKKCTEAGLNFIGPPWQAVDAMGDKSRSKEIMTAAGVPCIPGYHGSNQDPAFLAEEAEKIGYPVLLKAVKGGGGKGMRIALTPDEFSGQLESAKSEARSSFGDDIMLVEKYITTPRHIEVQVFADKHGNAVALGERDCSIQRRHQKILEESPAPNLPEEIRQDLWAKARDAALAVNYEGAGTVEFIFDNDSGQFFFMEMNTRLQVEHPVTEMVTGQDLVSWQIRIAEGAKISMTQEEIHEEIKKRGHAIEARIYAENPDMNFVPDSGTLLHLQTPTPTETVRIDAGFAAGDQVSSYYDPMIAKLIVQGPDRETALQKMTAALEQYQIAGPQSNIEFLKRMCVSPGFVAGEVETGYIGKNSEELFRRVPIESELWAQAAIGLFLAEQPGQNLDSHTTATVSPSIGFGAGLPYRKFNLVELPADGKSNAAKVSVKVQQIAPGVLSVTTDGKDPITITSKYDTKERIVQSFFPHTRLETRFIRDPETNSLILFQQGRQYRVQLEVPKWAEKVLGMKDVKNSVLAPMPCKVLRVEVSEGAEVKKNQPLVVIESMKMETVIRAPQDGKIAKVVHKAGDLCKAGTALVEFEEVEESS
ncbi:carbamoyl-phosphate synthase L chain, ATP binding domain-containing protein [Elsinoe ampelina]|uniref:Carbamoyl-phosphate synthase L chain, ATP binding domain-containing protein n=1 Tax=Elsinoe ampelina TaxID=302913 RepID=A0A6A6GEB5_9PEZI|nr:carbamoyl-phosphate synthase L chain, ATP binding domain-containing protein [Elsinoe ampelina]